MTARPPRSPRLKLHVKLRSGVSDEARGEVIAAARASGASAVRRLFPDSRDEELSTLYTVDVVGPDALEKVVKRLESLAPVDYVEAEVKRTLRADG